MIVLFLLFLLQFSLACACLAVNSEQELSIAKTGWQVADNQLKTTVQYHFDCCAFEDYTLNSSLPLGHPTCEDVSYFLTHQIRISAVFVHMSKFSYIPRTNP